MFVFRFFSTAMRAISQGFLMIFRYVFIRSYATKVGSAKRRLRSKTDMELKFRENPIVTTLNTPEFKKIFTPEVIDLKKIFDKYQHEIRVAGGAVRDLLMGQEPKDIDFATTATPIQMKEMFTTENIRMINMSGEKHGTITPRINDKENFEVTTLRIDMVTDGRHAEVEYTTDWKLDANRRDLTINSMFLDFNGDVYDYFFGYEDLQKRRVAFVGDADVRLKEDYLRIMRYFRFYGRIAKEPNNHEVETLKIIRNNVDGLENVSGERIWMELKKTLQGNYASDLLKTMLETGVGEHIGLPASLDTRELERVAARGARLGLHPVCYLAALLQHLDQAALLHARLKFSVFDRDLAFFLLQHRRTVEQHHDRPMRPYEKLVVFSRIKINDIKEYVRQLIKYRGEEESLEKFNKWELPRFPIGGKQLKEIGVPSDRMYGKIISQLKEMWFESEYKLTAEDLVELIPDLIKEFDTGDKLKNDLEIKKRE